MQFQKVIAADHDPSVIEKYYSRKFAREAEWEDVKSRLLRIMDFVHINYKSYAEEYEDFIESKLKSHHKHNSNNNNNNGDDYYSILGVDRCSSEEEIKRSFRVLIMQYHPDFSEYDL